VDGLTDQDDKKKNKDKKHKNDVKVLTVASKGKAPPKCHGKPDDLPVYYPIHRSTKHIFLECLVYKKLKQEEEQACQPEGPIRQEPP
jgi:hypothetical protein